MKWLLFQRCIHREIFGVTSAKLVRICPPGWNMVKVSENLDETEVVPVATVVTSLVTKLLCQKDSDGFILPDDIIWEHSYVHWMAHGAHVCNAYFKVHFLAFANY